MKVLFLIYIAASIFGSGMMFYKTLDDGEGYGGALLDALLALLLFVPVVIYFELIERPIKWLYRFFEPVLVYELMFTRKYIDMDLEKIRPFYNFYLGLNKSNVLRRLYKTFIIRWVLYQSDIILTPKKNHYTLGVRKSNGHIEYFLQYPSNPMVTLPEELGYKKWEQDSQNNKAEILRLAYSLNKRRGL